ncbi:acidic repeat-containing protein-like [Sinocyclocheilus anshuiensis]|uniref:Acidic repeat-containing protein-like n=1 Tax=Sinocyclocheilus anshuiensis TaxID=1608454 RepID=A0A671LNV2_9TELE|nr:PREDICTED: acidic repeat-containing protein-like [Sinocyclocheilus anshuiensis]XP_016308736.1 PREDICTED: acidic repeat-containing protein-like [Sinocyclocheilus anshuiensis]
MDPGTVSLFQRVSEKLGWDRDGGLDRAEEKLRKSLKKNSCDSSTDPAHRRLLSDADGSGKENQSQEKHLLLTSDEEELDKFLAAKATPKSTFKQSALTAQKPREPIPVLSSDSDDEFETFLNRVKTPKAKVHPQSVSSSDDSLKRFIVDSMSSDDDFVIERKPSGSKGKAKTARTPKSVQKTEKRPPSLCGPPVFLSDSDSDGDAVIKSSQRTRLSRPPSEEHHAASKGREETAKPCVLPPAITVTTHAGPEDTCSSEEEFQSLLDRVRQNQNLGGSTHASPKPPPESKPRPPCLSTPSAVGKKAANQVPVKGSSTTHTPVQQTPRSRPVSHTEPRAPPSSRVVVCKTPGCFLQSLSVPGSSYCRSFRLNKEELTNKLFQLYNTSVFGSELPADMSVSWNKKMCKTAGYCISGQERGSGERYARIELSVKVCDSADRLRDTLVHEMCHAATWLINNVHDGHGPFWRLYARKAMLAHPELPMVSRCHSYDINFKYQYQCNRCKNTIGRHSKSLDTTKFVCALCTGQLVLLTPSKPRAPAPFATFVKENYSSARQELEGQSHAEVMRKLSADFASKTRLSQS